MKDYNKDLLFSKDENAFAIELEVHESLSHELQEIDSSVDFFHESDEIIELNKLHRYKGEDRGKAMELFDFLKDYYKDKFPMGQDGYTSGGNHFHIFGEMKHLENKGKNICELLLNCPLFAKFQDGNIYSRNNCRHSFSDYLGVHSKSNAVTLKNRNYGGEIYAIEFRCNNVIDDRLLGYYQAICIMAYKGIELEKLKGLTTCLKRGSNTMGSGDMELSNIEGKKISDEQSKIISNNISVIIGELLKEGLIESAKQLISYCEEFNLLIRK